MSHRGGGTKYAWCDETLEVRVLNAHQFAVRPSVEGKLAVLAQGVGCEYFHTEQRSEWRHGSGFAFGEAGAELRFGSQLGFARPGLSGEVLEIDAHSGGQKEHC